MSDEAKVLSAEEERAIRSEAKSGRYWTEGPLRWLATLDAERARSGAEEGRLRNLLAAEEGRCDEWKARAEKAEADATRRLETAARMADEADALTKRAEAAEAKLADALFAHEQEVLGRLNAVSRAEAAETLLNAMTVRNAEQEAALAKLTEERNAIDRSLADVIAECEQLAELVEKRTRERDGLQAPCPTCKVRQITCDCYTKERRRVLVERVREACAKLADHEVYTAARAIRSLDLAAILREG